jgi:uncharacterized protein YutE (UPF0331/DUF86 family)
MLSLLDRYRGSVTRDELETDRETWLKVRGALEVAAQCAIDLALALVSRRQLGVPQTYRDAFAILARNGVIDPALAAKLEGWAGLRNVLVHTYTGLDLDRVHQALSETGALAEFHRAAARELADR